MTGITPTWIDALRWDDRGLITVVTQEAGTGAVLMVAWMNREALELTARTRQATYWSRSRGRLWRKGEESGHTQAVREIRADCDGDTLLLQVEQKGGVACHTGRHHCFFNRLERTGTAPTAADAAGARPDAAEALAPDVAAADEAAWVVVEPVLEPPAKAGEGRPGEGRPGEGRAGTSVPSAIAGEPADTTALLARLADVIEARRGTDPERSYVARLLARSPDAVLKKIGEEATETVMAAKDGDGERIVAETADLWFHCLVMLARFGLRPEQVLAELERREGVSGLVEKAGRPANQRNS